MSKVFRCYCEKRDCFRVEAEGLLSELIRDLGIGSMTSVRIFNRYDAEGLTDETYKSARASVFSEPQCDDLYDEELPDLQECRLLAIESLPGQYDQRADSCEQCIQILVGGERPKVATAKVYAFFGNISETEMNKIKSYLINPVETREASSVKPDTLTVIYDAPLDVEVLDGFINLNDEGLKNILEEYGLAMDIADLSFFQEYFISEKRDPTITELRVIDTYWSDHCRHTTFGTHIDEIDIRDEDVEAALKLYLDACTEVYGDEADMRPVTLMNLATMGMKVLKKRGLLQRLDESDEVNACSVHVDVEVDGEIQDWLLMFKNETHNHPTEIEPFGGAATCVGGAIRDPLSGRSYVYQAMRVTGSGDPTVPLNQTMAGKLPQRKLTTTAAAGYSSYGNQIGLATGLVNEIYHPGYVAKRLEIGAVVGAAPADRVVRETPEAGDIIILLGGRTGRDGCGGATGSSKTHTSESLGQCAAEVQKGNAPEERKIQRLFRDPEVTRMIRRCNDFGAGGVSVAIGELADGLKINLDAVPIKYEGIDGTELAISESQERMAVVVAASDAQRFIDAAAAENLEATIVAEVTEQPRMVMTWRGKTIVNISREFLNSNGAVKHANVFVPELPQYEAYQASGKPSDRLTEMLSRLGVSSQRGLIERFDSSIGAASVIMPLGGRTQLTPSQVMAASLPTGNNETETCSVMAFGFNPFMTECRPFVGAQAAVVESVSKLVAAGTDTGEMYLSLQEYFEKLKDEPHRWGKPFSALLGAFSAQLGLEIAAIGGKDSMSGSFMDMNVPPTLVSFAIAPSKASNIITSDFKAAGNPVYCFYNPVVSGFDFMKRLWADYLGLCREGKVLSGWALTNGAIAEGIFKMSVGNEIGFKLDDSLLPELVFNQAYGSIIAECTEHVEGALLLGYTTADKTIDIGDGPVEIDFYRNVWEGVLEPVFPTKTGDKAAVNQITFTEGQRVSAPVIGKSKPRAVIPVFPGNNCEYDTARAVFRAGGEAEILVVKNLTPAALEESIEALEKAIRNSQMIILPGGFSGGDEPDGSGKFIAAFFRNKRISDTVHDLLYKNDGLMLGICNGFQALIKLGLIEHGRITEIDENSPTLAMNAIGRHQSRYVTTRVSSNLSPWLSRCEVGELHSVPVSHGEGRFVANEEVVRKFIKNGQIAFQYTDENGNPSMDIRYNPNGSLLSVEGISSPDGRVLGKMAHTERSGIYVAKNISGNKLQPIFESGVEYFKV